MAHGLISALGNVLSAISWWVKGEKCVLLRRPEPDILEAEAVRLFSSAKQERNNRRVRTVCGQMFVNRVGTMLRLQHVNGPTQERSVN